MASDAASTHNQDPDKTENVSPADTQEPIRFESINYGNSEHSSVLEDAPQQTRPSAISSSTDNYGTLFVKYAPS